MRLRHLTIIAFILMVFYLNAGHALASHDAYRATSTLVSEPGPTLEDKARFEQLATVLKQSEIGRNLLAMKDAYEVHVRFEAGVGSSFMQAANRIRLDTALDPVNAALIFAHEMNHARAFHEGEKAHRKSDSRQAYIHQMLWEESEGMAISIQVKMELAEQGVDVEGTVLPFEDVYRQAYKSAIDRSRLLSPSLSADQLHAIGRAAGAQVLFEAHLRGETRTSNTHETCFEYYARLWDEVHPIRSFVATLLS